MKQPSLRRLTSMVSWAKRSAARHHHNQTSGGGSRAAPSTSPASASPPSPHRHRDQTTNVMLRHQQLHSGSEFLRLQSLQCRRPPILLLLPRSCRTDTNRDRSFVHSPLRLGWLANRCQELAPRQGLRRRTGCSGLTAATRLAAIRCFGVLG
jgi:hypothetical protein